jgi:hypothetical protein
LESKKLERAVETRGKKRTLALLKAINAEQHRYDNTGGKKQGCGFESHSHKLLRMISDAQAVFSALNKS